MLYIINYIILHLSSLYHSQTIAIFVNIFIYAQPRLVPSTRSLDPPNYGKRATYRMRYAQKYYMHIITCSERRLCGGVEGRGGCIICLWNRWHRTRGRGVAISMIWYTATKGSSGRHPGAVDVGSDSITTHYVSYVYTNQYAYNNQRWVSISDVLIPNQQYLLGRVYRPMQQQIRIERCLFSRAGVWNRRVGGNLVVLVCRGGVLCTNYLTSLILRGCRTNALQIHVCGVTISQTIFPLPVEWNRN